MSEKAKIVFETTLNNLLPLLLKEGQVQPIESGKNYHQYPTQSLPHHSAPGNLILHLCSCGIFQFLLAKLPNHLIVHQEFFCI